MRTREECEAEIISAQSAYREAIDNDDQLGADLEELVLTELVAEYDRIPQQRQHP